MKDFDRVDIGGARTMEEVEYYFKQQRVDLPCRVEFGDGVIGRIRAFFNRATARQEGLK